jgi:hypothetical protein
MAEDIIAQVVVRSPDGSSILEAPQPITAATIAKYRVGAEMIQRASTALESLGFKVLAPGPTGFTLSGNRALFERIFDTILQEDVTHARPTPAPRFAALRPLTIPAELSSLIAAVVLPVPPDLTC